MPITSWRCPACLTPQPLDHFASTACGNSVHPDFASAVLADAAASAERAGRVGVSDGFGCPRRKVLSETHDGPVDPVAYNSMLTGTAWHSAMEGTSASPDLCEVEVGGVIAGITLVGHIDRVRFVGPAVVIDDWKHTNDYSFGYLRGKGGVAGETKPEHEASVSLYAELYAQTFGRRPAYGMIWYHATAGGFLPRRVALWTIERCLAFRPYGGDYTVGELYAQVAAGIASGWESLPLAGESQSFGAKDACSYCAVRETCWTQERGAPF